MVQRRSLIKAGLAGAVVGLLPETATAQSRRVLRIQNVDSRKQTIRVRVDGQVELGPESESDEDAARNEDGIGRIRSVLDPDAIDTFYVRGDLLSVDWTRSEPRLWIDGRRIDPDDLPEGDGGDGDDDDELPSRIQFVATADDLEAFLRVSGRLSTGESEVRVILDRREVRTIRYSGNIRELRTANGEIDVYISQK